MAALAMPSFNSSNKKLYDTASLTALKLGRVTRDSISVYSEPNDKSRILFQRFQDDILNIYDTVKSEDGPAYNPYWHRVWGGYVHSAYVQIVRNQLNPVRKDFPEAGQLMELTVPFSQSYRPRSGGAWEQFYKLYYSSTYWVSASPKAGTEVPGMKFVTGDGTLLLRPRHTPAHYHRRGDFPSQSGCGPRDKRIEISLDHQTLKAYEGDKVVLETTVSTGMHTTSTDPAAIPTDTPNGDHMVRSKKPSVHMGDGTLRSDAEAYELPGVPWVSYFEIHGYALHGTYWHNNFGVTMSHGCVNMRSEDAKWIYRWSTPKPLEANPNDVYHTPVLVTTY
jgi:hypothetical protein